MDAHVNFARGDITTGPSPATTGATMALGPGQGADMPTVPFNAVATPPDVEPVKSNSEVVRVTAMSGDSVTAMLRAQEFSTAKAIAAGWVLRAGFTAKILQDIETAIAPTATPQFARIGVGVPAAPLKTAVIQNPTGLTRVTIQCGSANGGGVVVLEVLDNGGGVVFSVDDLNNARVGSVRGSPSREDFVLGQGFVGVAGVLMVQASGGIAWCPTNVRDSMPDTRIGRAAAGIAQVDDANGNLRDMRVRALRLLPMTFADLPPTATLGVLAMITDAPASANAWGSTVTGGGGTNVALLWFDGTNWTLIGK